MPRPVLPIDDAACGRSDVRMKLADLPTPCLVLDRGICSATSTPWRAASGTAWVPLRPHMKTAKSIDVARLALAGQPGGITVSTLAEAEYFASHGITDILYAVGITPQKLDQVAQAEQRRRRRDRADRRSRHRRRDRRASASRHAR